MRYTLDPPTRSAPSFSRRYVRTTDGTRLGYVLRGIATGRWHAIAEVAGARCDALNDPTRAHRSPHRRLFATAEQAARWVWLQHRPVVYTVKRVTLPGADGPVWQITPPADAVGRVPVTKLWPDVAVSCADLWARRQYRERQAVTA